jgi:hypothetical protein
MTRQNATTEKLVTQELNRLLDAAPAYKSLPPDRRQQISRDTVRIAVYLTQPEGIRANGLAGAITAVPPGSGLVQAVDFPAFVGGLIQGVFQAIVDSSIQQMEAYADLVKSLAQTVDRFASTALTDDNARDWLTAAYPDCLDRDPSTGKLRLRSDASCMEAVPRLRLLTGQSSLRKLKLDQIEAQLVPAAKRRLAASRQQLLSTMVLMGINRIVVTDGSIGH